MMFYTMCFVLFIFFVLFLLPLHDVDITATVATATSSRSSLTPLMERFSIGLPASEQKNNIYIYISNIYIYNYIYALFVKLSLGFKER